MTQHKSNAAAVLQDFFNKIFCLSWKCKAMRFEILCVFFSVTLLYFFSSQRFNIISVNLTYIPKVLNFHSHVSRWRISSESKEFEILVMYGVAPFLIYSLLPALEIDHIQPFFNWFCMFLLTLQHYIFWWHHESKRESSPRNNAPQPPRRSRRYLNANYPSLQLD